MRNKILFALLLILVFAMGVFSLKAWQEYKVSEQVKVVARQAEETGKAEQAARVEAERKAAEVAEKARIKEECEAGLVAYNKLTPFQKTQTEKPVCDLKQVQ